jgi:hypothetical protein
MDNTLFGIGLLALLPIAMGTIKKKKPARLAELIEI